MRYVEYYVGLDYIDLPTSYAKASSSQSNYAKIDQATVG